MKDGWIPTTESLPKSEQDVLISFEHSVTIGYYYIDPCTYDSQFEDLDDTGWYNEEDDFMYDQNVIAWMPLPEPYKQEEY